jgi:hypothetical protein
MEDCVERYKDKNYYQTGKSISRSLSDAFFADRERSKMGDIIDDTFGRIRLRYGKIEKDLDLLPSAVQHFIRVYAAQGVIDNGGYRYFFESNWPGKPPYSVFIEAYKAISCEKQSKELERIVNSFPFEKPHLYKNKRQKYMDAN